MQQTLLRNTLIIGIGRIMTQFMALLMLPLYTSFLPPNEYGTSDLVITYAALALPFVTLSLEQGAFRLLVDTRDDDRQKTYVISFVVRIVLLACIVLWAGVLATHRLFDVNSTLAIVAMLYGTSSIWMSVCLWFARGLGGNLIYAKGSVLVGLGTVVFSVIFIVVLELGAIGMLLALALANFIGVVYFIGTLQIPKYTRFRESNKNVNSEILRYSLPLIPNSISWWLINVFNRTVIAIFIGVTATGIFAVATKFPAVLTGLFSIFWVSWHESASMHIDSENKDSFFSKVTNVSIQLFGSIGLIILSGLSTVFTFVVASDFREAYIYIPVLMLAALCNAISTLYGSIYAATKTTGKILYTTLLAALVNIAVLFIFIHSLGLFAAAFAALVAHLTLVIYRHFDVRKHTTIAIDYAIIAQLIVASLIVVPLYYLNNLILNYLNVVVASSFLLVTNRKLLVSVKEIVWQKLKF